MYPNLVIPKRYLFYSIASKFKTLKNELQLILDLTTVDCAEERDDGGANSDVD